MRKIRSMSGFDWTVVERLLARYDISDDPAHECAHDAVGPGLHQWNDLARFLNCDRPRDVYLRSFERLALAVSRISAVSHFFIDNCALCLLLLAVALGHSRFIKSFPELRGIREDLGTIAYELLTPQYLYEHRDSLLSDGATSYAFQWVEDAYSFRDMDLDTPLNVAKGILPSYTDTILLKGLSADVAAYPQDASTSTFRVGMRLSPHVHPEIKLILYVHEGGPHGSSVEKVLASRSPCCNCCMHWIRGLNARIRAENITGWTFASGPLEWRGLSPNWAFPPGDAAADSDIQELSRFVEKTLRSRLEHLSTL